LLRNLILHKKFVLFVPFVVAIRGMKKYV